MLPKHISLPRRKALAVRLAVARILRDNTGVTQSESLSAARLRSIHETLITASNELLHNHSDRQLDNAVHQIGDMLASHLSPPR